MTKAELMENYTKEGLADEYVAMKQFYEVEKYKLKYMKELEEQNKKCKFEIAEYQKKIKELTAENSELQATNSFQEGYPTEPIKVANILINEFRKGDNYTYLGISELRQIAEHLLVYCNHNEEAEE